MVPTEAPEPDGGIRRDKKPSLLDGPPLKKDRVSPIASATPLTHASPVTAVGSELSPATAAPSVTKADGVAAPAPSRGEVAQTAATLLAGKGGVGDGVREALEESAQLARAQASARARVASLRARGASLPEL